MNRRHELNIGYISAVIMADLVIAGSVVTVGISLVLAVVWIISKSKNRPAPAISRLAGL